VLHQVRAQASRPVLIEHVQLVDFRDRAAEFKAEQIRRQQIASQRTRLPCHPAAASCGARNKPVEQPDDSVVVEAINVLKHPIAFNQRGKFVAVSKFSMTDWHIHRTKGSKDDLVGKDRSTRFDLAMKPVVKAARHQPFDALTTPEEPSPLMVRARQIVSSVLPLTDAALVALIANYSRQFPGIEIHLRQGMQNQTQDDVRSGAADFAIGYIDDLPGSFVYERVRLERFYAVFAAGHPTPARRVIDFRSLKGATLVSFPPDSRTRRVIDGAAATLGFALHHAITVNQRLTLLELVRNGAGIAILPSSDCPPSGDRAFISCLVVGRRLSCQLGTMRLRERTLSPAATALLSTFTQWMRSQRHGD
jgi:DNA-binding transcriptional LysR family regulator